MAGTDWTIESRADMTARLATPGFVEATVFHGGGVVLDPFLALTDFHMSEPTFAPHPHAGFSAVTYMFRDARGTFRNRDSLGDESLIGPGDLHWTQAGAGMMHEEIPIEPGPDCHGLQLFVNLRSDHKLAAPHAFHVNAADVPIFAPAPGVTARVVVGEMGGVGSHLDGMLTRVSLVDVELQPSTLAELPVDPTHRVVLLVVDGTIVVDGTTLPTLGVVSLTGTSPTMSIRSGDDGATVLLLAGTPLSEPVLFQGPFCMNTSDQLDEARRRYTSGAMGTLSPSF